MRVLPALATGVLLAISVTHCGADEVTDSAPGADAAAPSRDSSADVAIADSSSGGSTVDAPSLGADATSDANVQDAGADAGPDATDQDAGADAAVLDAGADANTDECAPNPCENGGTCTDGNNSFTCACAAGFSGPTCATAVNNCAANPCQNGGTCTSGGAGFTCACAAGYSGTTCATNVNDCAPNPCQNGGACTDGVNSFTCACAAGYSGTTCTTNINDCAPNPCQNGGLCTDGVNGFSCLCDVGFMGPTCTQRVPSCLSIKQRTPAAGSGVYTIDPDGAGGAAPFSAYCDMTTAGGGWTLVSNRRANSTNIEACGVTLGEFFTNGCGLVANIGEGDSYALTATQRTALPFSDMAVIQYLGGVADLDDAYIVKGFNGTDPFPNTNVSTNIAVTAACDIDDANCDTTNVFWKYIGDFWYHSSQCLNGSSFDATYRGNYGLCDDGANNSNAGPYDSSRLFGNRAQYNETKLWAHPNGAAAYQERVFLR